MTVTELIERLKELPPEWVVEATKSGRSLQAHEAGDDWWKPGHKYAYVFTNGKPNRYMVWRDR